MAKLINVRNSEVVVTDIETGNETVQPYSSNIRAKYVVETYTSVLEISKYVMATTEEDIKEMYGLAGDQLGCSVKQFSKMLNGAIYRAYIEQNKTWHNEFSSVWSFSGKKHVFHPTVVKAVNDNAGILNSYVKDGLRHVAGFGIVVGDSAVCKTVFGKGLWKKLCSNSKCRNDMIAKTLLLSHVETSLGNSRSNRDVTKSYTKFLNEIPSTVLKHMGDGGIAFMYYVANTTGIDDLPNKVVKYIGVPMYKLTVDVLMPILNTINDTYRMIGANGFNNKWSISRISNEHNKAVLEEIKKKSSSKQFDFVKVLPNRIDEKGFVAELCKSPLEMAVLGGTEHHCVGIYGSSALTGNYAVYRITDGNGLVSTLGIRHPVPLVPLNDQHYHKFNKSVDDVRRIAFGHKISKDIKYIMLKEIIPRHLDSISDNQALVPQDIDVEDIPF